MVSDPPGGPGKGSLGFESQRTCCEHGVRRTTVGSSVKKKWPAQFESKVFDRVFNRHFDILQLPQAAEMEGSSRGGAVMARGGRHGDQRRLDDFMHSCTHQRVGVTQRAHR